MAAKAGATYVSPFIGRLDDTIFDGMAVNHDIRRIFDNYDFGTQILAASIRTPNYVREGALIGADAATMPTSTLRALIRHPLTDKASRFCRGLGEDGADDCLGRMEPKDRVPCVVWRLRALAR
jgi:transaldolase